MADSDDIEVSVALPPPFECPQHIATAEQRRYRRAYLYDTPFESDDVWLELHHAAELTTMIGLGPVGKAVAAMARPAPPKSSVSPRVSTFPRTRTPSSRRRGLSGRRLSVVTKTFTGKRPNRPAAQDVNL